MKVNSKDFSGSLSHFFLDILQIICKVYARQSKCFSDPKS